MNFRTELVVRPATWSIGLGDPVLTIGSCFAQSIGQRFVSNKFQTLTNPFGTTYHPMAIHKLLSYAAYQEYPPQHTYAEREGIYFNYDFHSSLSGNQLSDLQQEIQSRISAAHYYLKNCAVLIITYGTAWLYERVDTGEAVGNCHRMPPSMFDKRLSTLEEIEDSFQQIYNALQTLNPKLKIILTLSPVRHIKDTLPLNSVSKSMLRVHCHRLAAKSSQVEYFPAYELMIDDLRDYRYYGDDLIHPTAMAEEWIWTKFGEVYFSKITSGFLAQWGDIQLALSHNPFHPRHDGYQQFLLKTLRRLEDLSAVVNVDKEISELRSKQVAIT